MTVLTSRTDVPVSTHNPSYYRKHPSGIECIDIKEWLPSNLGDCLKYLWRAGEKAPREVDVGKALWYAKREAHRLNALSQRLESAAAVLARRVLPYEPDDGPLRVLLLIISRQGYTGTELYSELVTVLAHLHQLLEREAKAIP